MCLSPAKGEGKAHFSVAVMLYCKKLAFYIKI